MALGFYTQQLYNGMGGWGSPDTLWITIKVFEMDKQNLNARDIHHITRKAGVVAEYNLLAPNEIFENINHSWDEYDSMQGRLGQLVTSYKKEYDKVKNVGQAAVKNYKKSESQGEKQSQLNQFFQDSTTDSARNKMDTPLVYSGSARREYNLTFYLHDQNQPELISQVADAFRRYGCARIGAGREALARIDIPYIFELSMTPGRWIFIKNSALTAIQTTYGMPYIRGHASQITMSLTFLDLQPLYEASFEYNPTVLTTPTY